ncbi:MAG TPA: glycosyl transferase [Verrucomicrobia bacterium]|nr:MAG: glycosyl transferase [Lentisphaerae bacterium GWF2_57_35]HBA83809.1 glycosyl transferase [Verrucomicrobiota bacterium]
MKLSVVIPVFNEEATLRQIIERVQSTPHEKELIVVDDGSIDGTPALLRELSSPNVIVLTHAQNRGKGAAVRTALEQVHGEVAIIQDADLEYTPNDYPALIEPIVRGDANVVYGSRIMGTSRRGYLPYYLGGRTISWAANILYGIKLTDLPTGYKAFKTSILKNLVLEMDRFAFCAEVTAKLARQGHAILEVPISYQPRSFREGKKITWHAGLDLLWTLIRCRWK